jgi:hypothetical protein
VSKKTKKKEAGIGVDVDVRCIGLVSFTYNERDTFVMGQLGNGFEIRNIVSRIADSFHIHGFRLVIDGCGKLLGRIILDEFGLYSQSAEEDFELIVSTTVEVTSRDDVVTSMGQRSDGHELSSLTRRGSHCGNTTFKSSNSFLKDIDGGL